MPVNYICRECDSEEVTRDAWAAWDLDAQKWALGAAYDYAYCHMCEAETRLVEIEISDQPR